MLLIEIPKSNEKLIASVKNTFDNCEIIEVDSLGADTIDQILVPAITIGIPATAAIIKEVLKYKMTTVKYDGIEISGSLKSIIKILEKIITIEKSKKIEGISSQTDNTSQNEDGALNES